MTIVEEKFLELLKNFMWAEDSAMEGFAEWKELFELSSIQNVFPMVYEQICRTPQFQTLPLQLKGAARQRALAEVTAQLQRTAAFLAVYGKLLQDGIQPLVVKGLVCRELYPSPDDRLSSDEDLLIRREEFENCDRCLQKQGFEREELSGQELPQEISYVSRSKRLCLEVHLELFTRTKDGRGRYADLNEEFTEVFSRAKKTEVQGTTIYTMGDTDHFYYLLCHALKHFLHAGVGIRQLCDMLMMANRYGDEIDWIFLRTRMERLGILQFFMSLMEIGKKYLGFSCEKMEAVMPDTGRADCRELLEDMLNGGVYGASSAARIHSANMTLAAAQKRSGIWKSLFPETEYMHHQFSYLDRYPWLLPAAYAQRMLKYGKSIRRAKGNLPDENTDSIRMGRQRVRMMKKYGIVD